ISGLASARSCATRSDRPRTCSATRSSRSKCTARRRFGWKAPSRGPERIRSRSASSSPGRGRSMAAADGGLRRKLRVAVAWLLTLAVVVVYFALPDGERPVGVESGVGPRAEPGEERRLDVVEVSPADAVAGAAITITYVGALDPAGVRPYVGRDEMQVLARKQGAVVARLPQKLEPGRVKIRVTSAGERS